MRESKFKRKCVGCNTLKEKSELIKITRTSNQEVIINPPDEKFGRSVYLCKDEKCIESAFKKGRIFKILKIKTDENLKEKIRAVLEN